MRREDEDLNEAQFTGMTEEFYDGASPSDYFGSRLRCLMELADKSQSSRSSKVSYGRFTLSRALDQTRECLCSYRCREPVSPRRGDLTKQIRSK